MDYISNQLEKNISQINEYSLKSLFELDASLFPGNMRAIVFEALKKKIPNFTFEEFISFFVLKNDQLTIDQREFIWENTIKKWAASPLNVKKLNLGNLLELFSLPVKMFSIEKRTDFFDALFKNLADLEFKSCYYHLLPVFYSLTIEKLPIKHRETYMLLFLMKIHSFDQLEIDDQKRISALFDNKKTGMLTIESVKFLFEKLPEDKKFNLLNTAILSKVILNKEDFDNFLLFLKSTSPDASKHVFNLLRSELGILEASYDNYLLSSLTQKTNFSSGFFELPSKNNHATASTEKLSGELTLGNKPFILYIKNLSGNMIRIDMNDDSTFLTVLNKLIAEKIYDPNLEVFRCFAFGGRGYYEDDFDKPLRDLNIEHTDEIYLITHHFIKYEPTKEATPNTASFFGKSTNTGSTAADASAPTPSRLGPKGSD